MPATLLVCADNPMHINAEFFAGLEANIIICESPNALLNTLKLSRPHGVCLIFPGPVFVSRPPWLQEIERRAHFEGLKVAALIHIFGENFSWLSEAFARFNLASVLGFREVLLVHNLDNANETTNIRDRLRLCLGLHPARAFDDNLSVIVKKRGKVKVALPARISWFDDDNTFVMETSVRLNEGAACVVKAMSPGGGVADLHATCISSNASDLRFNYGSQLKLAFLQQHAAWLRKLLITSEKREKMSDGRPFRRALVVIKNPVLRDSIVQILRKHLIEARVPLVWKNVRLDCQRMNPHFVIIEDTVLLPLGAKLATSLKDVRDWIGDGSKLCLLGQQSEIMLRLLGGDNKSLAFIAAQDLEKSLDKLMAASEPSKLNLHQQWLAADSVWGRCLIEVEENYVGIANRGIVIESTSGYRSLCSVFLDFGMGNPHPIAKNLGTFLVADAWRNLDTSSLESQPINRYNFTFSIAPPNYYRDLYDFLGRVYKEGSKKIIDNVKKSAMEIIASDDSASELEPYDKNSIEDIPPDGDIAEEEISVIKPRKKKSASQVMLTKENIVFLSVLIIVGVIIYVLIQLFPTSSESIFVDSFSELYKKRGK